jgi:threonine/homoserine/homoserine lactone efflux protein
MSLNLYLAFVAAAAVLILVPGPTVMLVTSTSLRSGPRAGLIAVAGSTTAAAVQLAVVVAGLASAVTVLGDSFEWIRWAGVAYLVYLGLRALLRRTVVEDTVEIEIATRSFFLRDFSRGFIVTLTNPKTLLFLGAFLPQFVDATAPPLPQLLLLSVSFLLIAGLLDSAWALLAARIGSSLRTLRGRRLSDRVSGSLLICAGAALAFARRAQ